MEIVILDDRMLEFSRYNSFDSLVWNERYQEPGDFQMRSYGINATLEAFRENMLVGVDNSDYVMQVTDIETDVDSQGNEIVTVMGKTLEHIFAHRPAVPKISSVFAMEADWPDGWDFGFEDEEIAKLDPFQDIMMQVIHHVDVLHYQRDELSYLSLPFQYYFYSNQASDGGVVSKSKLQTYYVVDRSATVQDVFDELLPEAEMGIATLRPRPESAFWDTHQAAFSSNPDRPGLFLFYRPRALRHRPTFDYLMEDYTSESVQKNTAYTDVLFQADEDGVASSGEAREWNASTGWDPERTGMNTRVRLREREKFNLKEHELNNYHYDMGENLFRDYAQANTYSIETSGRFPYDYKRYRIGSVGASSFFLGDIVRLNLQREKDIDVQVKEYIRSQDADGYKEYPTFAPYTELGSRRHPIYDRYVGGQKRYKWN